MKTSSDVTWFLSPDRDRFNRRKWFPGVIPAGIQVVDRPGILQRHADRTWVTSLDRFLGLLI
ncbi:MAG: hypothetical protein JW902_11030 [Syntrophaceae bacterium]|nr:hypothetical protein [Syntrophaceae bacterium]